MWVWWGKSVRAPEGPICVSLNTKEDFVQQAPGALDCWSDRIYRSNEGPGKL